MTASEFAFLALGLVLGVATGAAIIVVLGSKPPPREVKLTVETGAIPRRASTLSIDAFVSAPGEVARGGPADRRRLDRDAPLNDPPPPSPYGPAGVPVMRPAAAGGPAFGGSLGGALRPIPALQLRTNVPSRSLGGPSSGAGGTLRPTSTGRPAEMPPAPGRDPSIHALRAQAGLAAEHAMQAGQPTATALLEAHAVALAEAEAMAALESRIALVGEVHTAGMQGSDTDLATSASVSIEPDPTPAITRILRGDHRALLATVAALAGPDEPMRRPWQAALTGLAEAIVRRAINRGILDFPVGNPFWDTFTTEQCRHIAAALAAGGHRFDGIDGWEDGRIPTYRDLTFAVASAGLEPRRIRAWPTQEEIALLYREVTVAADEEIETESPDLDIDELREVVGPRAADLDLLWEHWDAAREILASPVSPT